MVIHLEKQQGFLGSCTTAVPPAIAVETGVASLNPADKRAILERGRKGKNTDKVSAVLGKLADAFANKHSTAGSQTSTDESKDLLRASVGKVQAEKAKTLIETKKAASDFYAQANERCKENPGDPLFAAILLNARLTIVALLGGNETGSASMQAPASQGFDGDDVDEVGNDGVGNDNSDSSFKSDSSGSDASGPNTTQRDAGTSSNPVIFVDSSDSSDAEEQTSNTDLVESDSPPPLKTPSESDESDEDTSSSD
mmetsp:Transcript_24251/g.41076  ORF Transcript_24251/g.41076 Transcript_24251/m.41076 type:complete len:254 (+) Transcript_24251:1-762(+)